MQRDVYGFWPEEDIIEMSLDGRFRSIYIQEKRHSMNRTYGR